MIDILNKQFTLVLNALFMPMGTLTIKKSLVTLCSSENGMDMAAQPIQIEYELNEDGSPNFFKPTFLQPITWEEHVLLPLRDFDIPIRSPRMTIRAPLVIISKSKKIILKKLRPTIQNLYNLYGGRCVWTNKILSKNSASKEHLKCKSDGGDDSFSNVVLSDRKLNSERGNTPVEKWKYQMKYSPKNPRPIPFGITIKNIPREEWKYFLFQ